MKRTHKLFRFGAIAAACIADPSNMLCGSG